MAAVISHFDSPDFAIDFAMYTQMQGARSMAQCRTAQRVN